MADFDENWLRLALVIHEAPTVALKSVLDKAISKKYAHLKSKSFEEKLEISLKADEAPLSTDKKKFLLDYEVPTVFPSSGCPGAYDTFDVGIVCRLIKYFVGEADFDKETASLPRKPVPRTNKQNIDFEKLETEYLKNASELALVEVIREYRNFIFHHTGSPVLSKEEFNHHWNNLMRTLTSLGYDVKDISIYQTLTLDYSGRLVVDTIEKLLKEAMRSMLDELASKKDVNELRQLLSQEVEWIGNLLGKFQADMQRKEHVLNEMKELLPEMARKKELHDLKENLQAMIATFEARLGVVEGKVEVHKERLDGHDDDIGNLNQGLNDVREGLARIQNRPMNSGTLKERKHRAQEACKSDHERLLKLRELDIFGSPMKDVRKSDLMVSLTTVECRDLDTSRLESASDLQKFVTGYSASSKTVALQDLFKTDEVVLLRGHPGAGKSTLCHFILKEWIDGRLWSDKYDFVFYVNAPRLATLLKVQPFDTQRVLAALYPDVFKELNYEELREFKCLIMVDAIDECDIEKICAREQKGSFEEAINHIITSSERKFHRIILGRPSVCDAVRTNLLQHVNFEFVEVVGFTVEQLREYVDKFSLHDKSKSENLWQRISDNEAFLAISCLPIFANVICNVLSENANVEIKTETELYVWSYFLLVNRHRIPQQGDKLKASTFDKLFKDEKVMDELEKISKIAFEKLQKKEIFFKLPDFDSTELGTTFFGPCIVRCEEYFSFAHLTQMEFFAAVHLFVTSATLTKEIVEAKHLQGVVGVLFGLLGGAVKNSDSAQIVRDFVQPLMKGPNEMKPLEKHPLTGDIAELLSRRGDANQLSLHVCFEFQNLLLLKHVDERGFSFFVVEQQQLTPFYVTEHYQLSHVLFCTEHVNFEEQGLFLGISPFDGRLSEAECRKLRRLIELRARKVRLLNLFFAISEEKMEILAPALVLVPNVNVGDNQISEESWKIFLCAVQRNQTRRIKSISYSCAMHATVSDELRRLNVDCVYLSIEVRRNIERALLYEA